MKIQAIRQGWIGVAGLAVVAMLVAWSGSPVAAADSQETAVAKGPKGPKVPPVPSPLTAELKAALTAAIQDEYHARAIYEGVVQDFGNVAPFVAIIKAEQRHASSLATLFQKRGLPVPASGWNTKNAPHFATVRAACAAAAEAEIDNVDLYDLYLDKALPTDLRNVFENNRAASLYNHLPAFTRCK